MKLRAILREFTENDMDALAQQAQDVYDEGDHDKCRELIDQYWSRRKEGEEPGFPKTDGWLKELERDLQADETGVSKEYRQDYEDIQAAGDGSSEFDSYMDPDSIFNEGCITFIYGGAVPRLYTMPYDTTHLEMISKPAIARHLFKGSRFQDRWQEIVSTIRRDFYAEGPHAFAQAVALLGRVSPDRTRVSIWNTNEALVKGLYPRALRALASKGYIDGSVEVHAPMFDEPVLLDDLGEVKTHEMSPDELDRIEAMRQIHLSPAGQKKELMKRAGVGMANRGAHPMAQAMQRSGLSAPGHKWWAPTSEHTIRRIDAVLDRLDS